jgi:hypothetical protein
MGCGSVGAVESLQGVRRYTPGGGGDCHRTQAERGAGSKVKTFMASTRLQCVKAPGEQQPHH